MDFKYFEPRKTLIFQGIFSFCGSSVISIYICFRGGISYEKRCSSSGLFRFSGIWALLENWPLLEVDFDFNLSSMDFDFFFL